MSPQPEAPIYVAGSGSFAIEIAGWAADCGIAVAGFVEMREPARVGSTVGGFEVLDSGDPPADAAAVIGMGGDRREARARLEEAGWRAAGLVHPSAHIAANATLAPGTTIGPLAVVGAEAEIGEDAILSRGVLVGHHARVGAFATLNPGANVGGNAEVQKGAFLGMSCVVLNGVEVGEDATVAAGAVAVRDVAARTRVQGVPAVPYSER